MSSVLARVLGELHAFAAILDRRGQGINDGKRGGVPARDDLELLEPVADLPAVAAFQGLDDSRHSQQALHCRNLEHQIRDSLCAQAHRQLVDGIHDHMLSGARVPCCSRASRTRPGAEVHAIRRNSRAECAPHAVPPDRT